MNPPPPDLILFLGALGLVLIGTAGLVLARDMFRAVLALAITEAGANLFIVLTGFRWNADAPILVLGSSPGPMVDPVPQAMVLTAIVIGVGVQALAVGLLLRIHSAYGTLQRDRLAERLEQDIADSAGTRVEGSLDHPPGGQLSNRGAP